MVKGKATGDKLLLQLPLDADVGLGKFRDIIGDFLERAIGCGRNRRIPPSYYL